MKTIFEALREDHDKQRSLLDLLIKTQGDSEERAELFAKVKDELQYHAGAEERFFYNPLFEHDLTQEKSRHSVAEHHEIDELIETLEETDRSSSHWLGYAKQLSALVLHHLEEEEHEVFQLAGKALSDEQKTVLAASYEGDMQRRRESEDS